MAPEPYTQHSVEAPNAPARAVRSRVLARQACANVDHFAARRRPAASLARYLVGPRSVGRSVDAVWSANKPRCASHEQRKTWSRTDQPVQPASGHERPSSIVATTALKVWYGGRNVPAAAANADCLDVSASMRGCHRCPCTYLPPCERCGSSAQPPQQRPCIEHITAVDGLWRKHSSCCRGPARKQRATFRRNAATPLHHFQQAGTYARPHSVGGTVWGIHDA